MWIHIRIRVHIRRNNFHEEEHGWLIRGELGRARDELGRARGERGLGRGRLVLGRGLWCVLAHDARVAHDEQLSTI